jgi:hypothetical protein
VGGGQTEGMIASSRMWMIDVNSSVSLKSEASQARHAPPLIRALDTAWIGAATRTCHGMPPSTRRRAGSARRARATLACQRFAKRAMTGGRSSRPATANARRGGRVWKRWFAGRGVLNGDLTSELQVPDCTGAVSGWHGR